MSARPLICLCYEMANTIDGRFSIRRGSANAAGNLTATATKLDVIAKSTNGKKTAEERFQALGLLFDRERYESGQLDLKADFPNRQIRRNIAQTQTAKTLPQRTIQPQDQTSKVSSTTPKPSSNSQTQISLF
jgi:hypothetical protein